MVDMAEMHAKQQYYVDCIERLRGGAVTRLEWDKLFGLLDHLTEGVPLVLQPVTSDGKFARGRILGSAQKFDSIRTLAYPPKELCGSYGRCNKPGHPAIDDRSILIYDSTHERERDHQTPESRRLERQTGSRQPSHVGKGQACRADSCSWCRRHWERLVG